jgi:hypothetical protein
MCRFICVNCVLFDFLNIKSVKTYVIPYIFSTTPLLYKLDTLLLKQRNLPVLDITVFFFRILHCRQRAPVEKVLSASGTSHLGMIDIEATTKSKYYDHIVLSYFESRRCRYLSIIFVCFYLYVTVVNFIDYSDMDKMMDINNDKC